MSKSLGTDWHVRQVVKSQFHYGQLVRRGERVGGGFEDADRRANENEPGTQAQTSSTRKMFQGYNSVCARPRRRGKRESAVAPGGRRGANVAIVCLRRYPPTLTYHASTDDVDESGLHAPRSRAVRSRRGKTDRSSSKSHGAAAADDLSRQTVAYLHATFVSGASIDLQASHRT